MSFSKLVRKPPTLAVLATAVAVALGAAAHAQDQERENANRPGESAQIARSDAGMQTLEQHLQNEALRVSNLVGKEVQNRSGDNLGEVEDVIRAAAPGQDMQLVVSTSGVGADEKLIAVPFDEIQISADGDELYANLTRTELESAAAVQLDRTTDRDRVPLAQRDADDANRDAADRDSANREAANRGAAGPGGAASASLAERRLADLIGAEVIGSDGEQVGEVDDIVISMAGADTIRAVLQAGGIAGIGEKRVALPLGQITVDRSDADEPSLRVAMDLESLERLPEFEYEEDTTAL